MRNVLLIVRRELAAYARTPSGYVITAATLLVMGLLFNALAVGDSPRLSAQVLEIFFRNAGGLVMVAAVIFSMRLLAEERTGGTQMLLFTSPIREGEIVVGKYLAGLTFLTILILLSLYLPALIFVNGKVSFGHIGAGYLGMFFVGATTLAIGTFASSLVKTPFLAVLLSAVFVVLLELCFWVARLDDGVFATVLGYLPVYWNHFQPFSRGLLQLSDVIYYLSVTYLSLLAATRVVQSQRWQ